MTEHGTNEPGPLEVEPSPAGATGTGDHGPESALTGSLKGTSEVCGYSNEGPAKINCEPARRGPGRNPRGTSYRRTNEPGPLEVEGSTAGASGGRDHVLPLRIVDQPGGAVIRCLCGRELASLRKGVTELSRMRGAVSLPHLSPDISPAGLLVMIVHAKGCRNVISAH